MVDYEAGITSLSLTIRVEDSDSGFTDTAQVTITVLDVNDNAPAFTPASQNATEPEDVAVDTEIAVFTAADMDLGVNSEFE